MGSVLLGGSVSVAIVVMIWSHVVQMSIVHIVIIVASFLMCGDYGIRFSHLSRYSFHLLFLP